MNSTILNRDFQHPTDGWYQIEPKGEHPNHNAKLVQVIDDEAIGSIVNRFNADAQSGTLRHGREMLIDHEHFSDQPDKETRAYGWLQELQNRADGIYGRIRWTTTGKTAVDGGDYRFFSTEYDTKDLKVLNSDKKFGTRVRPLRLDGLSLTNMNNNRGQKPITNRSESDLPGDPRGSSADNKQHERKQMKSVATKLGLSADASEEAVLAEVTKVMNRVTQLDVELAPIKNRVTELETQNTSLLGEQVDALMDAHKVEDVKVRNRLKPILSGLKNREDRIACLVEFGFDGEEKPAEVETQQRVLNRATGKTPKGGKGPEGENADQARAQKIHNRASELKSTAPSRDWDSCWQQAEREVASK